MKVSDDNTGNGVYVLANGADGVGFYRWMGGKLGAGRVYLELPASGDAPAYLPFSNDETTGIETVQYSTFNVQSDDVWYTLDGRRLNGRPAQKGLFIYNGKKVTQ